MSLISIICMAVGYLLFFFTENMVVFPILLMIAAAAIAAVDLTALYKKEKLDFGDFVKEAFMTNWGSMISVLGAIFFIFLCIF